MNRYDRDILRYARRMYNAHKSGNKAGLAIASMAVVAAVSESLKLKKKRAKK